MKHLILYIIFIFSYSLAYSQSGTLDNTFGIGGKVTYNFGTKTKDEAKAIAFQNDGKIIVAGKSDGNFALLRYNTNGTIDSTFGSFGRVLTSMGPISDEIYSLAIQSDGKILAAGLIIASYDNQDIALARFNNDGSLDSTFDHDGKLITSFGGDNEGIYSMSIQNDGKILVGGSSENSTGHRDILMIRYNPDGSMDSTFNHTGKIITQFQGTTSFGKSVAQQQDGKIVLAGQRFNGVLNDYDFTIIRYDNDGRIDSTFGTFGIVTTDFGNNEDGVTSCAIQSDGKIVVAGWTQSNSHYDFALARYNNDGSLDQTFGIGGKITSDINGLNDICLSMVLQNDNKIVAAGWSYTQTGADYALIRYNHNGNLDSSFNANGIVITDFGYDSDGGYAVGLQNDGKIVMVGSVSYGYLPGFGYESDFAMARYNNETVSVKENLMNSMVAISPNPANGIFTVSLTKPEFDTKFCVYDLLGHCILNQIPIKNSKQIIDLSSQPKGIYFLEITSGNERAVKKIVIQ